MMFQHLLMVSVIPLILASYNIPFRCLEGTDHYHDVCTLEDYDDEHLSKIELQENFDANLVVSLKFANPKITKIKLIVESFANIKFLDLSHCDMKSIKKGDFELSSSLAHLNLAYNNITDLVDHPFSGAYNLTHLNLSGNRISEIDRSVFKKTKKIIRLDLSNNMLVDFNCELMFTLVNLKNLRLNNNLMYVFSMCNSIEITNINLNNNNMHMLTTNSHTRVVRADNNRLINKYLNLGNNLIHLSLRNNFLTNIDFIKPMHNLSYLDLSFNPLEFIETDVFLDLVNLKILLLQSVNYYQLGLDMQLFSVIRSLDILDISDNNLTLFIDIDSITHVNYLKELHINGNNLTRDEMLPEWNSLFRNSPPQFYIPPQKLEPENKEEMLNECERTHPTRTIVIMLMVSCLMYVNCGIKYT